jgi:hypothetical protein
VTGVDHGWGLGGGWVGGLGMMRDCLKIIFKN